MISRFNFHNTVSSPEAKINYLKKKKKLLKKKKVLILSNDCFHFFSFSFCRPQDITVLSSGEINQSNFTSDWLGNLNLLKRLV